MSVSSVSPLTPLETRILDLAYDAVFVMTGEFRILFWNRGAEELYGWTRSEAVGRISHELLATRFPEPLEEIYRKLFADGHWEGDLVHTTRDGRKLPVSARWSIERGADGQLQTVLEIVRDITARKRYEMEIRRLNETLEQRVEERTRELQEVNRELEAFTYSVSHDLRAPLRSIDGFSRLLLEESGDRLTPSDAGRLHRIRAAASRMGQLIDALLDLSRLTRTPLERDCVVLSTLARHIANELERAHPDRRVEFLIQPDLKTMGDRRLLRILLDNLLGNAFKFTGGVESARIEFGSLNRDGECVFFVRDNGVGFDMQYAGQLFQPFQRLHGRKEFEGTGIGLATVRRVVIRHGGRIWAEAEPDRGATFFFTLGEQPRICREDSLWQTT